MLLRRVCLFCVLAIAAVNMAFAQVGASGTILGTITDSSGAILPNVKVAVTNTATNAVFNTVTSSAGDYSATSLTPGLYKISAEISGFEKSVTDAFTLAVDQKIRVNLSLKAGAVTQTVEVTAQAVNLDTDTAALSQEMSADQVAALPLNGRNFMQLLLVGAGAVTVGGEQGTMRQGEGNAVSINGGRPEGNNYTLDGLVNTDQALQTPAVILSQDAIGEFKVESGIYPAENGFGASQINIVSKGGTNSLHGALFESNRNNAFDTLPFPTATDYIAGVKTDNPVLKLNQFGFVVDGPVYIPKIYNGRNKTFFMANYEGWRMDNGARVENVVPTPAELSGDFSQTTYPAVAGLPGGPLPAYGTPTCTAVLNAKYDCLPADPNTGLNDWGSQIPAAAQTARVGAVAVSQGFWSKPTVANTPEGVTNFFANIPGPLTMNQQTYRGDQILGKYGSVFGRYTHAKYVNSTQYNSGSINYGIEQYFQTEDSWEVAHTISIGAKNVNNFRFGKLRAQAPEGSAPVPASVVSALGLAGTFTTFAPLQQTYPNVGFGTGGFSSGGGPVNSYSGSDNPNWEYADSFTTVHGKHTIGLGIDYRRWQLIRNLDDDFYGDYTFSGKSAPVNTITCPNPVSPVNGGTPLCGTGNSIGDMLTGYYNGVGGFVPGPLSPTTQAGNPQDHVFSALGPYVEDDWKVTQKLSINYGLRWDFRAAAYEASNHFFWLDTTNTQGGLCYADPKLTTDGVAPGVGIDGGPILRYCGKVPHPGSKTPFAPRFGVNYRVNDKTVVRGGYGIFFDSYEGREIDDSADIYPYSIRNSLSPTTVGGVPKLTNQLFPSYSKLGPFPESTLSFIAVIESENPINPYVQSYTLSLERELARNTTLEVNYIGTKSTHLLDRRNIAQPNEIPASSLAFCEAQDPVTGSYINITQAPCTVVSRLPYPNFNGFYINSDFHGYANYNATNIKFEHRAHDLAATAVFTWARSMDDKSAAAGVGATGAGYQGFEDNHNPNLDYGPSDFDVDHRFVASYVYQLPVGRGKKFAGGINRVEDLAVGGWQLTGITTFQTGFPYTVQAADIQSLNDSQFMHANIVPGCQVHSNLTAKFQRINTACFTQPALGTFGNTARNAFRQPGINNWDMGFGKDFDFTERLRFTLKMDTFNTFNHHQYGGDVGGLLVAGSGGNAAIDSTITDSKFGLITTSSKSRILQFSGKITF
jgi:Carboxypeptidase regulatory-like domain